MISLRLSRGAKLFPVMHPPSVVTAAETPIEGASSVENPCSLDGYPIYDARAVLTGAAFCFTAAISAFAAGPEDAGFCPVISRPSLTT